MAANMLMLNGISQIVQAINMTPGVIPRPHNGGRPNQPPYNGATPRGGGGRGRPGWRNNQSFPPVETPAMFNKNFLSLRGGHQQNNRNSQQQSQPQHNQTRVKHGSQQSTGGKNKGPHIPAEQPKTPNQGKKNSRPNTPQPGSGKGKNSRPTIPNNNNTGGGGKKGKRSRGNSPARDEPSKTPQNTGKKPHPSTPSFPHLKPQGKKTETPNSSTKGKKSQNIPSTTPSSSTTAPSSNSDDVQVMFAIDRKGEEDYIVVEDDVEEIPAPKRRKTDEEEPGTSSKTLGERVKEENKSKQTETKDTSSKDKPADKHLSMWW
eukprot:sb/3466911/